MIPLLAAKVIPTKTIAYVVVALIALHVLGVYPMDVLITDVLTVIAGIVEAIGDWFVGLIEDIVRGMLPGGDS